MIDKQEFYHGAAVIKLLDDRRCERIKKNDLGYIVNNEALAFIKYSTKTRSPWRFIFSQEEIDKLISAGDLFNKIIIVFICGGDGICAVSWSKIVELLASEAGWISTRRNFNEQYAVAGSHGKMKGKIPLREWPSIIFGG